MHIIGMKASLRDALELSADNYPDKTALVYPSRDQRWTYTEFDRKANQLANALAELGIERGDRVSTMLYNGTEMILTLFACAKLGAVFNPLNYRLPADQAEYILNDAGATLLVFEEATRDVVESSRSAFATVEEYLYIDDDAPDFARDFYDTFRSASNERPETVVREDDIYALLYTSGTTGRPKGVVHDHHNIIEHTLMCIAEERLRRTETGLSAFPLYHAGELHGGLIPRIQRGATTVVRHEFDPAITLQDIETYGVNVLFAAPTGWTALAEAADDVSADFGSLRLAMYGGGPMPEAVLKQCLDRFDVEFFQAYGMTEITAVGTVLYPVEQLDKQESAGLPALNRALRIVEPGGTPDEEVPQEEVGEIIIASPSAMQEYWNRPDETKETFVEDGRRKWYYTGDVGYVDADGYLYVVDRTDNMIVSGGENIYPAEIENVLSSHPDVTDVAVVGEQHEKWGEQVVAYVVGEAPVTALDRAVCESETVADFKRPRKYYFVEELPRNPIGKVQKFKLREGTADLDPEIQKP